MTDQNWMIGELHKLRQAATSQQMELSDEAIRVAILSVAIELNVATGLSVKDLAKGSKKDLADKYSQ